jgi:hypothetical protein
VRETDYLEFPSRGNASARIFQPDMERRSNDIRNRTVPVVLNWNAKEPFQDKNVCFLGFPLKKEETTK